MSKSWYVIHTYTGYEQKIERTLRQLLESNDIDSNVLTSIKVPMETVVEVKDNKARTRNNKLIPGYMMLEMDLPELGWKATCNAIRRIQGVTGFVGTAPNQRPRPISTEEARSLLQQSGDLKGEKKVRVKQNYEVNDKVKIIEGPFATFEGVIEEFNAEKNKLRVNVQIFGRATPVEVDVLQVEKI
ncbi:MAG: transcription termination/antitermination factor NusG [Treponema sp.]|jgi:transcriptional antiterminator NusG|nr:transcription termination/antitermination factor NusG [Treponema sp.]HAK69509.1 transcription termination/antitermination factor NusG [Treponema sp.]HBB42686.1 transcription termination/antitermination factor NusG [Treponema sp.]